MSSPLLPLYLVTFTSSGKQYKRLQQDQDEQQDAEAVTTHTIEKITIVSVECIDKPSQYFNPANKRQAAPLFCVLVSGIPQAVCEYAVAKLLGQQFSACGSMVRRATVAETVELRQLTMNDRMQPATINEPRRF